MSKPLTAVVLMNLGGPDSTESVEPFLRNLFSDRDLIQLPMGFLWQGALARRIARARSPDVRRNYERIGGRSPIVEHTEAQARALEAVLGEGYRAYVAMRYWHPFTEEAVERLVADGATEVVALPLYPHRSRTTSGSSMRKLRRVLAKRAPDLPIHEICSFPENPGLLDAWATAVRGVWEALPAGRREAAHVLFSAHGLPQRVIDNGDPYLAHVQATVRGVMGRLPPLDHSLAFQSRATRQKWLEPATEDALASLAERGVRDVLVVPIAFVTEHVETLYELDIQLRELAEEKGLKGYHRVPVPALAPSFIEGLARLVRGARQPEGIPACRIPCGTLRCIQRQPW